MNSVGKTTVRTDALARFTLATSLSSGDKSIRDQREAAHGNGCQRYERVEGPPCSIDWQSDEYRSGIPGSKYCWRCMAVVGSVGMNCPYDDPAQPEQNDD